MTSRLARGPEGAPPRPDLGWLRHRRATPARPIDYVHPGRRRTSTPAPAPAAPSLDLSRPAPSLDLSRPTPPPPTAAPPPARPARPRRTREEPLPYPRVRPGAVLQLARPRPTVTLTRLQSGVGAMSVSLLRGPAAGDLALGMVCETTDGALQVVQQLGDLRTAQAPGTPLPLARLTTSGGVETVSVDLRSVRRLRRALFYGFSPSISVLTWDAVVRVGLHDGAQVEARVEHPPLSGTLALLTAYVVAGEVVLRAEMEPYAGPPEMAALAYGYSLEWLAGRTPVR